jgi:serine/threonine protein phosphatase PrpC
LKISTAHYSSRGGRIANEDNTLLAESPGNVIAIVADGLGGEGNGDLASLTTVNTIGGELAGFDVTAESLLEAISRANEEIIKLHNDNNRMKSTAAVLYLCGKFAYSANIGDSRTYQFRKNKVIYQSVDHSVSQMAVDVGEISVGDIRWHVDRNRLTNALGAWAPVQVDLTKHTTRAGDAFLLCSDGFWEYVLESEMQEDLDLAYDAYEWLRRMRDRVELRITPTGDNHSAIAIIVQKT